jgi:cytidyltransferase-like protein
MEMENVVVSGSFDDMRSFDIRFLEEAARLGTLHVFLWSDELVRRLQRNSPKFPLEERLYMLRAIRYVNQVHPVNQLPDQDSLPPLEEPYRVTWVVKEADDDYQKRIFCSSYGLKYRVVKQANLNESKQNQEMAFNDNSHPKKVVVTGCYDWLHSGHMRFFEEASELGDLYVVVGADKNVRLLKGDGHPMFPQDERMYVVQSVRFVKRALISSGSGWMDAAPEIARIKPDFYVVNEDGDVPEKRNFCVARGIQYVVLKRKPKEGLPKRQSVDLRGF